ncbi:Maf family protein [Legionella maioricensis]|uniref:Nucleoside triphosphate pyrophosphatase n=1 Tax=Legionella maioricensis TaxID=2896528 RepID=A0A9X2CY06_9GAMM|nr:nucleoside triphosphate pyrophosphatase [Legionella maioricensis]MCL9682784.1 Maf family protein [Legionella maioricensis]MCL9686588.1 Maf family protein [Legionella maioricensis]
MSKFLQQQPLILASSSAVRLKLFHSLGLEFLVIPSECDEEAIKKNHQSESILDLGLTLAKAKALDVSERYPEHFVIAADQLCVINNKVLDKPLNHQTAIEHLQLLSGKKHQQISCVCIAKHNEIVWQYHDMAHLSVRHLSEKEINAYLHTEQPYHSCGAYHYEARGKWLFTEVQGNEDTILGLPLLPLANAMINLGAVHFI